MTRPRYPLSFKRFFGGLSGAQERRLDMQFAQVHESLDLVRDALGRIEGRQVADAPVGDFEVVEFKAFSQFGEDGILSHLLATVDLPSRTFIEFGVEDYTEANTRFLVRQGGWRGVVFDGDANNIRTINRSGTWRYDLTARQAFVTAENINDLLIEAQFVGDVGLLSIDIDGNDYWVWKAVSVIRPAIVICEYNARWGAERSITVPYDPMFRRELAHYSWCYFGASLTALTKLGAEKGYSLVACDRAGVNAFFVLNELLPNGMSGRSPEEAFIAAQHREARGPDGKALHLTSWEEATLIEQLPVVEV